MARPKGSKNKKLDSSNPPKGGSGVPKKVEQVEVKCHVPEGDICNEGKACDACNDNKSLSVPVNKERQQKLNSVLKDINKNIKGANVDFANTIEVRGRLSTGYKNVDKLIGGGIPQGVFSTVWGSKGCGKTTLAYKTIATTQNNGKICAYIDMERSYDPNWAKQFGVNVDDLVYVACHTAEEALDVIIKLCKAGVVDLIVLDSIQGLSPHGEQYAGKAEKEKSVEDDSMALLARKLSQFFRMAVSYVSDAKCAVLLIGQARMDLGSFIKMETLSGGHALLHNSRLILRMRRGQGTDAPTETIVEEGVDEEGKESKQKIKVKIGFDLVIKVDKSQVEGCVENSEVHLPFLFKKGIEE
jgi:protein RecA